MRVVSLASGSKGNCIFVEINNTKLLVDQGLRLNEIELRLKQIDVLPSAINAILITHEHTDHCGGVAPFVKKYGTKVFVHVQGYPYVAKKIGKMDTTKFVTFTDSDFFIDDITIASFVLPHDSKFCVGYNFFYGGKKISIATDLGYVSTNTLKHLQNSDLIYLESNHDEDMLLKNKNYPDFLKSRILSPHGHLSNTTCGELIARLVPTGLKQVVLAHLSEENNTPQLAYTTIKNILKKNGIIEGENVFVDVATQNNIGTVFYIE